MRELYVKTDGSEPVTTAEVKAYVGYQGSDTTTETMIDNLTTAARHKLEKYSGRNFVEKTMVLSISEVPTKLELPMGPIYEVESVKVYDTEGVLDETLTADDDYYLLGDFDKYIRFESWFTGAYIKVEYTAGYGANTFTLPDVFRMALLRQIKYDYDYRGNPDAPAINEQVAKVLDGEKKMFL